MTDATHTTPAAAPDRAHRRGLPRVWLLISACVAAFVVAGPALAQVTVSGRGRNFVAPVTDAQGRKSVLRGKDVKPAGKGMVEILGMQAETYRGQEKDMIVEAPQCVFDTKANVASSPGSLSIRTADGRFSIKGESFRWELGDSRLNSKLVISNQVQSSIRKRLIALRAPGGAQPGSTPSAAGTPAAQPGAGAGGDSIDIHSREFDYQNDVAVFRGTVRVTEPDGSLDCGLLRVVFDQKGVVDRIEAEQDVVLRQAGTRATADRAVYVVREGGERVEFAGRAVWEDGARQGRGERLTFDRQNQVLRAETNAYLRLPRGVLGERGFLPLRQPLPATPGSSASDTASVEVFADQITVQLPATNGPVQRVVAEKNVLIVDAGQEGRALADRAVYEDATGVLELTGSPVLEMKDRLVTGQTLRFDRNTEAFTAAPDAYVKLPFQAVAELGMLPADAEAPANPPSTNRFVEIWGREFDYRDDLLQFRGGVRANFLEGEKPRAKLSCVSMSVRYAGHVESMIAEENVELEQFALDGTPRPVARRVVCQRLRAQFGTHGRLETVTAEAGVKAEQEERAAGGAVALLTTLTAATVTTFFSPFTNHVERIVAEKDVVFAQDGRVARGAHAVYSSATGLMELTGAPTATMPEGHITGAERLIWDRVHGTFMGKGTFKSEWTRAPGASPTAKSE